MFYEIAGFTFIGLAVAGLVGTYIYFVFEGRKEGNK